MGEKKVEMEVKLEVLGREATSLSRQEEITFTVNVRTVHLHQ